MTATERRHRGTLREVARVIRSKNSGPFELTLDVLFKDRQHFDWFRDRQIVTPEVIGRLYGVAMEDILGIVYFEPAQAVKVTIRRRMVSGAPGDGDVYGAQQHAPLLEFEFEAPTTALPSGKGDGGTRAGAGRSGGQIPGDPRFPQRQSPRRP